MPITLRVPAGWRIRISTGKDGEVLVSLEPRPRWATPPVLDRHRGRMGELLDSFYHECP